MLTNEKLYIEFNPYFPETGLCNISLQLNIMLCKWFIIYKLCIQYLSKKQFYSIIFFLKNSRHFPFLVSVLCHFVLKLYHFVAAAALYPYMKDIVYYMMVSIVTKERFIIPWNSYTYVLQYNIMYSPAFLAI